MIPETYTQQLGSLVGNFHSLELVLRLYLQQLASARPIGLPHGTNIYEFPVGTQLPLSEMTSYDSLGVLIDRFNREMIELSRQKLDVKLVEIRDALAHGRVSASSRHGHLRLLKFDKPRGGNVRVAFNQELSAAWLEEQTGRVYTAIQAVAAQIALQKAT